MSLIKQLEEIYSKSLALMTNKEALTETLKNFENELTSLIHEFRQITVPKESMNVEEIEKSKSIQITIDNLNVKICKDSSKSGPSKFSCETEEELKYHRDATHHRLTNVPIVRQTIDQPHADKAVFTCDKCDYITDTDDSLQYHTQAVHSYQCDKCNFTAKNKGWITRHIKTAHQIVMGTGSTDLHVNQQGIPPPTPCSWFWLGQEGQDQGPFPSFHMTRWLNTGLLSADSMLKREGDDDYASLENILKIHGPQPFGDLST